MKQRLPPTIALTDPAAAKWVGPVKHKVRSLAQQFPDLPMHRAFQLDATTVAVVSLDPSGRDSIVFKSMVIPTAWTGPTRFRGVLPRGTFTGTSTSIYEIPSQRTTIGYGGRTEYAATAIRATSTSDASGLVVLPVPKSDTGLPWPSGHPFTLGGSVTNYQYDTYDRNGDFSSSSSWTTNITANRDLLYTIPFNGIEIASTQNTTYVADQLGFVVRKSVGTTSTVAMAETIFYDIYFQTKEAYDRCEPTAFTIRCTTNHEAVDLPLSDIATWGTDTIKIGTRWYIDTVITGQGTTVSPPKGVADITWTVDDTGWLPGLGDGSVGLSWSTTPWPAVQTNTAPYSVMVW